MGFDITKGGVRLAEQSDKTELFAAVNLMPSQWAEMFQTKQATGVQRLACAVLESGIQAMAYQFGTIQYGPHARIAAQREAWDWVMSEEIYPFSFVWICQALELQADYLREGIQRAYPEPITVPEPRPVSRPKTMERKLCVGCQKSYPLTRKFWYQRQVEDRQYLRMFVNGATTSARVNDVS